jgi:hypothetical protein
MPKNNRFDANNPPIPKLERPPIIRVTGQPVWHGVTPNRFVADLPPVQGPVRARESRRQKNPNAPAIDGGTPQLPKRVPPYRGR